MSTAELLDAGLPAVLVPLPTAAEGHQMANARALEAKGVAVVRPEAELTGRGLIAEVDRLLSSPDLLERMSEAALSLARPHAAAEIAEDLDAMLGARAR